MSKSSVCLPSLTLLYPEEMASSTYSCLESHCICTWICASLISWGLLKTAQLTRRLPISPSQNQEAEPQPHKAKMFSPRGAARLHFTSIRHRAFSTGSLLVWKPAFSSQVSKEEGKVPTHSHQISPSVSHQAQPTFREGNHSGRRMPRVRCSWGPQ